MSSWRSASKSRSKDPKSLKQQGFTLVEVLVGILLLAAFTATAMQAIVSATAFKVKSQELSEATIWMQEDLELARYRASQIPADPARCFAQTPSAGYGQKLKEDVESASAAITPKSSALGQRPYTLRREAAIGGAELNVLKLDYQVERPDGSVVAKLYSEVSPDKFLECP